MTKNCCSFVTSLSVELVDAIVVGFKMHGERRKVHGSISTVALTLK